MALSTNETKEIKEMKIYQVIAKFHDFKGKEVQPFYIAKTYKNLTNAKKFVEGQKNHTKFYFEIEEKVA